MNSRLVCPISAMSVDKNAARLGATITAALLITFGVLTLSGQGWSSVFLIAVVIDYMIRVFTRFTPAISIVGGKIAETVGLQRQTMNMAPKIFAWRCGFILAVAAVIALPFSSVASAIIAFTLAGFNLLDGVLNFCVGCHVYTHIVLPVATRRGWVNS